MDFQSPTENKFGFLRAQFDTAYKSKRFDIDLAFYQGNVLSHYTNLGGLLGIVESGGFWMSDHRFLNDGHEFEDGRSLAVNLLRSMAEKSRYRNFRLVLIGAASILERHRETAYYICSFSKEIDSLDQWRAYAQDGQGISIVFENRQHALNPFLMPPHLVARMVVYSDTRKIRILLSEIRKYAVEHSLDLLHGNDIDEGAWSQHMATWLSMNFINFKHGAYASEQEVRLIASADHVSNFEGVRHRVGKHGIIPYISTSAMYHAHIKNADGVLRLPIREIRVGPAANQDILIRSIEVFLENKGYVDVTVKRSSVPYRG